MSSFSETLKYLREHQKLKQEDIGNVIGKSRETITKYENERAEPDLKTLVKLADHFGVSVDFLTGSSKSNNLSVIHPDIKKYEKYLQSGNFACYLELAAKVFDNEIDVNDVDSFVDNLIKLKNKYMSKKHP